MKTLYLSILAAGLVVGASAQTTEDNKPQGAAVNANTNTNATTQTAVPGVNSNAGATNSTGANASSSGAQVNSQTGANASGSTQAGQSSANTQGSANSATSVAGNTGALPSGTVIPAILDKSVDSKKNKEGDQVVAKVASDVKSEGKVIVPKGSKLIGHVTQAKSRAKGESQSTLGIMFDKAQTKRGEVQVQAMVQAIAAPVAQAAATTNDDVVMAGPSGGSAPTGAPVSGGGGLLGGTAGAVGGVANTAGGAVGDVGSNAGATVNNTTRAAGQTAGGAVNATGALTANSTGAIGFKDLQLDSAASNATSGSVITSTGKNVKLDSGTQMVLRVTGGAAPGAGPSQQ